MLFAQADGCSLFILAGVIGGLAESLTRATNRMLGLQRGIRAWAMGLGAVSGIVFFFVQRPMTADAAADPILTAITAISLGALLAALVWYLVIALLVFLAVYFVVVPLQFLANRGKTDRTGVPKVKPARGWVILPLLGGFIGFIVGVVQLGLVLRQSPYLNGPDGLQIIGMCTLCGLFAGLGVRILLKLLGAWRESSKIARGKKAIVYRESQALRKIQAEADGRETTARRKDAAIQADREAARKHLRDFYATNVEKFTVLFVAPSTNRRDALKLSFTSKPASWLYRFAAQTDLIPETFLTAPVWFPCSGEPAPLIKQGGQS